VVDFPTSTVDLASQWLERPDEFRLKVLHGNYDLVIDEKNRLLIPAEIRRAMDPLVDGEGFYIVTGQNGKPWLWPEKQYEAHAHGRGSNISPDDDDLEFDLLMFALSEKLDLDKQGRVQITEKNMKELGIGRAITLASGRDHLEIWDRAEWADKRKSLETRRAAIIAKSKSKALPMAGSQSGRTASEEHGSLVSTPPTAYSR
jgi:MraZ protein